MMLHPVELELPAHRTLLDAAILVGDRQALGIKYEVADVEDVLSPALPYSQALEVGNILRHGA